MQSRRRTLLTSLLLVLLASYMLAPIIRIVMMSFKSKADVISVPPKFVFTPTLDNYRALFEGGREGQLTGSTFLSYFKNSLIIALGAVSISVLIGLPAAYALARYRFRFKESLAFTYLS